MSCYLLFKRCALIVTLYVVMALVFLLAIMFMGAVFHESSGIPLFNKYNIIMILIAAFISCFIVYCGMCGYEEYVVVNDEINDEMV